MSWWRHVHAAPRLGKLNGDTKIANVGKKVYEGCFVKRDSICSRVYESGLSSRDTVLPPFTKEVAELLAATFSKAIFGKPRASYDENARTSRFQLVPPSVRHLSLPPSRVALISRCSARGHHFHGYATGTRRVIKE